MAGYETVIVPVMESGLVSVDRWTSWSQAYFLTHMHSDHTRGLTSRWSRGPLYCSRLTATLFPSRFPGFDLSLIRVVDIGSWISLSLRSPSSSASGVHIQFMAVDAHHCPGSLMFLFRGDFGCFLYTGDFRWEAGSKRANEAKTMLLNAIKDSTIDILYLDNTYCNPMYDFPSRQVAAQQVVDVIASHPLHEIIIGIDSLGKEELLVHVSRILNIKIWVWPERLQTMHLLGLDDIFTTDTTLTRVRAVPRYSFSIEIIEGLNKLCPTIGIMPSGLPWMKRPFGRDDKLFGSLLTASYNRRKKDEDGFTLNDKLKENSGSVHKFHDYIYSVQYSDHSCFEEIGRFIKLVQPSSIKGIVVSSSCYVDPLYYFGRGCGTSEPPQLIQLRSENMEETKNFLAVQIKSYSSDNEARGIERKRKKDVRISYSGAIRNRVKALRRVKSAKISETYSSD